MRDSLRFTALELFQPRENNVGQNFTRKISVAYPCEFSHSGVRHEDSDTGTSVLQTLRPLVDPTKARHPSVPEMQECVVGPAARRSPERSLSSEHRSMQLQLEPEDLKPIIEQVATELLARLETERAKLDGKLAYSEPEAAALIGLQPHQLRDERLRGRITASSIVGRRVRYLKQDLLDYMLGRRWTGSR
jgi:hypothetical protein